MGRHEIKLRRDAIDEGHIARHRNYGLLMKRHRRGLRLKRLFIVLFYVLIFIAILGMYLVVKRDEQRRMTPGAPPSTALHRDCNQGVLSLQSNKSPDTSASLNRHEEKLRRA